MTRFTHEQRGAEARFRCFPSGYSQAGAGKVAASPSLSRPAAMMDESRNGSAPGACKAPGANDITRNGEVAVDDATRRKEVADRLCAVGQWGRHLEAGECSVEDAMEAALGLMARAAAVAYDGTEAA